MRIAVLTWVEDVDAKCDPVVEQVTRTLRAARHDVSIVAVYDDVEALMRLRAEPRPDLVFNLFGDEVVSNVAVAGVLQRLGTPYTGGGPGELFLAQDDALARQLLAFEGLRYASDAADIEGRDLFVGVIGNANAFALAPLGPRAKRVDVSGALKARLQQVSIASCRALKVRDYARVVLRVNGSDEIFVLAVNANCCLAQHGALATGAKAAGIEYPELIDRIVGLALERHHIAYPLLQIQEAPGGLD